jgi:hypothetical protein
VTRERGVRSTRSRVRALAVLSLGLGACWMFEVKKVPALELTVRDDAGKPVPGATVTLTKRNMPHGLRHLVDKRVTDASGVVRWTEDAERKPGCVLIPHGVPHVVFEACAEAPGKAPACTKGNADPKQVLTLSVASASPSTSPSAPSASPSGAPREP